MGVTSMVVVDHEPGGWFLLRDDAGYVMDVNCSRSFVSYTAVLRLTPEEAAEIEAYGREAVDKRARAIQYSPSQYAHRYGDRTLVAASDAAIQRWRANRPAT